MSISAISEVKPQTAPEPRAQQSEDYTRFLTLLTAQITNQNPLKPMDANQFVTQLAQLSQVEQSVKTNSNLEELSLKFNNVVLASGSKFIGHDVLFTTDKLVFGKEPVEIFFYGVGEAKEVVAKVWDSRGILVKEIRGFGGITGELNGLVWDGTSVSGSQVPTGDYRVELFQIGSQGAKEKLQAMGVSKVEAVSFNSGNLQLATSMGRNISLDEVLSLL